MVMSILRVGTAVVVVAPATVVVVVVAAVDEVVLVEAAVVVVVAAVVLVVAALLVVVDVVVVVDDVVLVEVVVQSTHTAMLSVACTLSAFARPEAKSTPSGLTWPANPLLLLRMDEVTAVVLVAAMPSIFPLARALAPLPLGPTLTLAVFAELQVAMLVNEIS